MTTQNFAKRSLMLKSERRVEEARKQLKSDMEWTIRHLQQELQRLESNDTVSTMVCSAISDLPKDAAAFHLAKEVLADLKAAQECEQENAA
jgi:hypothetical protein